MELILKIIKLYSVKSEFKSLSDIYRDDFFCFKIQLKTSLYIYPSFYKFEVSI